MEEVRNCLRFSGFTGLASKIAVESAVPNNASKHAHHWISVTGGFTSTCRQRQWPWESSCLCPSHPPAQVRVASLRKSSNAVRSHTLPKSTAPATHGGQTCCHPASTGTDTILQSKISGNTLQHMLDLKKKKKKIRDHFLADILQGSEVL